MRKFLFLATLLCFCACSKEFEPDYVQNEEINNEFGTTHKISKSEALKIANLYFDQTQTRSVSPLTMEYIVNNTVTRAGSSNADTLAYILNRGADDGFVIVSSDNRVYPILAHSDEGTFEYTKGDIIDVQFISRLDAYLEENKNSSAKTVTAEDLLGCVYTYPVLSASWNQRSPWDKYVIREHPGCPAGCVAVAAGMVMTHCKVSHVYHGITFEFARIAQGLKPHSDPDIVVTRIINGETQPDKPEKVEPYPFEVALDYAAQLLYWIGKDVNMNYTPTSSWATGISLYYLLKNQGYQLKSNDYLAYNVREAVRHLSTNNLILMTGYDTAGRGGHAWVGDGCSYCVDKLTNDTINAQIHCDWGWGGKSNGYYSGEVFSASSYNFGKVTYLAVGIEGK